MEITDILRLPEILKACDEGFSIKRIVKDYEGCYSFPTVIMERDNLTRLIDINIYKNNVYRDIILERIKQYGDKNE